MRKSLLILALTTCLSSLSTEHEDGYCNEVVAIKEILKDFNSVNLQSILSSESIINIYKENKSSFIGCITSLIDGFGLLRKSIVTESSKFRCNIYGEAPNIHAQIQLPTGQCVIIPCKEYMLIIINRLSTELITGVFNLLADKIISSASSKKITLYKLIMDMLPSLGIERRLGIKGVPMIVKTSPDNDYVTLKEAHVVSTNNKSLINSSKVIKYIETDLFETHGIPVERDVEIDMSWKSRELSFTSSMNYKTDTIITDYTKLNRSFKSLMTNQSISPKDMTDEAIRILEEDPTPHKEIQQISTKLGSAQLPLHISQKTFSMMHLILSHKPQKIIDIKKALTHISGRSYYHRSGAQRGDYNGVFEKDKIIKKDITLDPNDESEEIEQRIREKTKYEYNRIINNLVQEWVERAQTEDKRKEKEHKKLKTEMFENYREERRKKWNIWRTKESKGKANKNRKYTIIEENGNLSFDYSFDDYLTEFCLRRPTFKRQCTIDEIQEAKMQIEADMDNKHNGNFMQALFMIYERKILDIEDQNDPLMYSKERKRTTVKITETERLINKMGYTLNELPMLYFLLESLKIKKESLRFDNTTGQSTVSWVIDRSLADQENRDSELTRLRDPLIGPLKNGLIPRVLIPMCMSVNPIASLNWITKIMSTLDVLQERETTTALIILNCLDIYLRLGTSGTNLNNELMMNFEELMGQFKYVIIKRTNIELLLKFSGTMSIVVTVSISGHESQVSDRSFLIKECKRILGDLGTYYSKDGYKAISCDSQKRNKNEVELKIIHKLSIFLKHFGLNSIVDFSIKNRLSPVALENYKENLRLLANYFVKGTIDSDSPKEIVIKEETDLNLEDEDLWLSSTESDDESSDGRGVEPLDISTDDEPSHKDWEDVTVEEFDNIIQGKIVGRVKTEQGKYRFEMARERRSPQHRLFGMKGKEEEDEKGSSAEAGSVDRKRVEEYKTALERERERKAYNDLDRLVTKWRGSNVERGEGKESTRLSEQIERKEEPNARNLRSHTDLIDVDASQGVERKRNTKRTKKAPSRRPGKKFKTVKLKDLQIYNSESESLLEMDNYFEKLKATRDLED